MPLAITRSLLARSWWGTPGFSPLNPWSSSPVPFLTLGSCFQLSSNHVLFQKISGFVLHLSGQPILPAHLPITPPELLPTAVISKEKLAKLTVSTTDFIQIFHGEPSALYAAGAGI